MKKAAGITAVVIAGICIPPLGAALLWALGVWLLLCLIERYG